MSCRHSCSTRVWAASCASRAGGTNRCCCPPSSSRSRTSCGTWTRTASSRSSKAALFLEHMADRKHALFRRRERLFISNNVAALRLGVPGFPKKILATKSIDLRGQLENDRDTFLRLCFLLPHFQNLERLWLDENELSAINIAELTLGLRRLARLRNLSLANNGIGNAGVLQLAELLPFLPRLEKLFLWNCGIDQYGLSPVAPALKHVRLTNLDLSYNHIRDAGADSLAVALRKMPTLRVLSLSGCGISHKSAASLAETLAALRLSKLVLGLNPLGDDGVSVVAAKLGPMESLDVLDVTMCDFGIKGFAAVVAAVAAARVSALYCGGNLIGDEGAALLARAAPRLHLHEIFIWHSGLSPAACAPFAEFVVNAPGLHTVSIGHNGLGEEGLLQLALQVSRRKFRAFYANNNGLSQKAKNSIASLLQDIKTLVV
eukprot:gnl/Chilomastix_cuspidata/1995.p1 GENE.gnl/Chilomastix_cuspidata/1995~~gnl/Chilomastix_cuspidata/1995.p1  ORF type:complete len:432 (+),score=156.77 gnl/Chilomastix_cuspidata/1995:1302-2597(+)